MDAIARHRRDPDAPGARLPSPAPELGRSRRRDRLLYQAVREHFGVELGWPAVASPNNVLLLFSKVATPPATTPQSAIWHFGWHVTDVRKSLGTYKSRPDVKLLPLYTTDEGGSVPISSDTWPPTGSVLGLTRAEIADARAKGVTPKGGSGFAYLQGPDGAIVEYQGNQPVERMNHVHMWQEQPFCAQLWYRKHLNASLVPGRAPASPRTEENCKVERGPDRT